MRKVFLLLSFLLCIKCMAQTPQATVTFNTITQMEAYNGSYTQGRVFDTLRGGIFNKVLKGTLVPDSGIIYKTGNSNYVWVRDLGNASYIDAKWYNAIPDTLHDNTAIFKKVMDACTRTGLGFLLSRRGNYGVDSIVVQRGVDFVMNYDANLFSIHSNYTDTPNYAIIKLQDSTTVIMKGYADMNQRLGSVVLFDGKRYDYETASNYYEFSMKGNSKKGQTAVKMVSDGAGVYGSASISYFNIGSLQAKNFDYWIYATAKRQGNINNITITHCDLGGSINGIYLYSDTTKIYGPSNPIGTGKTTIAYFRMISGNIRNSSKTKNLLTLDGCNDFNIDVKVEDVGRYIDTVNKQNRPVTITSACINGYMFLNGFDARFIKNYSSSTDIDCRQSTDKEYSTGFSPQSFITYPNGTTNRFSGGISSDYFLGAGTGALGFKPNLLVSTTSNTTDSLYKIFGENVNSFEGNVKISDANTSEKVIKVAINHPVNANTVGIEFGGNTYAPRYCKIEAYSQDSLKKFTLIETDTSWNGTSLMAIFGGTLVQKRFRCFQQGGTTICDSGFVLAYLKNIDTIYFHIKGNNWVKGSDYIAINRIWLYVNDENANNVLRTSGNKEGDTAWQKIHFSQGIITGNLTQSQRDALPNPQEGQLIYQSDNVPGFYYYNGSSWTGIGGVSSVFGRTGDVVAQSGDYTAAQVTNAVDATASYSNPSWITSLAWSKITGDPVTKSTSDEGIKWVNSAGVTVNLDGGSPLSTTTFNLPPVTSGSDTLLGANTPQTVTNKFISGSSNTLSNIATTALTGTLQAAQMPALTGDITNTAGSLSTTIANAAVTQSKTANYSANTIWGNSSNSSATPSNITFKDVAAQTYSGTIVWNGTTAPSGTTNHTYRWSQIGNTVTLTITLVYGTAGSALTDVTMTLPTDCPNPAEPSGLTAASNIHYAGFGFWSSNLSGMGSAARFGLGSNSSDNGYLLAISGTSTGVRVAEITVIYKTN